MMATDSSLPMISGHEGPAQDQSVSKMRVGDFESLAIVRKVLHLSNALDLLSLSVFSILMS